MATFSKRNDAINVIRVTGAAEAVLFLLDEQLDFAQTEILECNPNDEKMRDKLVRAQSLRELTERLRSDLK